MQCNIGTDISVESYPERVRATDRPHHRQLCVRQLKVAVRRGLLGVLVIAVFLAPARGRAAAKAVLGVVNLNTAPPATLELLPGIGPAKVQSILEYRRKHPFRTADELVRIKGIGIKMVKRLRPHLAVNGPTTAEANHQEAPPSEPPPAPRALDRRQLALCPRLTVPINGRPARTPRPTAPSAPANHCLARP
jgi:competence ComEA-like helix-hairpin-helix protein